MFKKLTSLLLTLTLCSSFMVGWAADETEIVKDDFNSTAIKKQGSDTAGYTNTYTSKIMNITRDAANRVLQDTTVSISEEGYEGKALQFAPDSYEEYGESHTPKNRMQGKVFAINDKLNAAEISYRFSVQNRGTGDEEAVRMYCGFSSIDTFDYETALTIYENSIILKGAEDASFLYETGTWYTAKFVVTKDKVQVSILNTNGDVLASSEAAGSFDNASIGFSNPESQAVGFSMRIDDAVVTRYRTADAKTTFEDVSVMHWAYDDIEKLYQKQIAGGKTETLFAPDDFISREEFIKMAVGTMDVELSAAKSAFTDVAENSWYAPYVATAVELGLASGISETEFGVGKSLTREDAMVILDRILTHKQVEVPESADLTFADKDTISEYAALSVSRVVAAGLIKGDDQKCVNPKQPLTRAEVCAVISRLLDLTAEEEVGDRLAQQQPPEFDPEAFERELICTIDFENGAKMPENVSASASFNPEKLDRTVGYESKTSYRMDAVDGAAANSISFSVKNLDLKVGDTLIFTAKAKPEKIYGTSYLNGKDNFGEGMRSNMVLRNSTTGEVLRTYQVSDTIYGTRDWVTTMQYAECTFDCNRVSIQTYLYNTVTEGTGWFDELSLYRVAFDAFQDAILERPNYKGLIYGEGGEGDINLSTSVKPYGGVYNLEQCEVNAKIVDKNDNVVLSSKLTDIESEIKISFSSKHLTMGEDYYLQLTLDNPVTGKQHSFREWTLRKRPADYRPNNYFDEYGRFVIDGKPTFMQAIYGMNYVYDEIDDIAGSPINVLIPYGWTWFSVKNTKDSGITVTADTELMDYAQSKGVKLIPSLKAFTYDASVSFGYFTSVFKTPDVQKDVYEGFAEAMDHPAVLGYYLSDEQTAGRYGPFVEWQNRVLSEKDLDGITFNTFSHGFASRDQVRFADIVNCSSYTTTNMARVTEYLSDVTTTVPKGNRPFYGVMQCYDSIVYSSTGSGRGPTAAEWRNMVYQAVCMNLQGIIWYSLFDMRGEEGRVQNKPLSETWPVFSGVMEELEKFYPVILSTEAAPNVEVKAGDWFTHIAKRHEGKTYLFTTNMSRNLQTARIQVEGAKSVKGLYSGETYKVDKNGWFEVEYPSIGVEVFEIEQDDFLSPEAEQPYIGFFNDNTSYFISNDTDYHSTEWKLHVPEDVASVEYAVKISDKAKLYINGVEMPASGTVSLAGVDTLEVTVVAEDSRFSTTQTYEVIKGGAYE